MQPSNIYYMSKNKKKIMTSFKKFFESFSSNLRTSRKEDILNSLLDKIGRGEPLNDKEISFMNSYDSTSESDTQDSMYLDKEAAAIKIKTLLDSEKKIICDLLDRNGKIGSQIINIDNEFNSDNCLLVLTRGQKATLKDKYLYNIIYDISKDEYSLQTQDEYYEKIPVKTDEIS